MSVFIIQPILSEIQEFLAVFLVAVETDSTAETGVHHEADSRVVSHGKLSHLETEFDDQADEFVTGDHWVITVVQVVVGYRN